MKDISYRKLLNLGTRTTSGKVNRIRVPNNPKSKDWSDIDFVNVEVKWKESCIALLWEVSWTHKAVVENGLS